ncbi:aquaporin NIP3-2-like [Panicum miliaceum]|uniref:Aquaporin NIP3-2-like n=1 Tax=Panicum miliaceum TaxID=4540 RepID=A0A3L6RGI6_PANMI|nr:aquaporin NIP3-2-like [Panicum miliaceum]
MDRRRSVSMDVSMSIPPPPPASMENLSLSDDKIAIVVPHMSPSNKILPLGFQFQHNEPSHPPPDGFATRVALPFIKKVAAELLGTFLLVFTVLSALVTDQAHSGALGPLGVEAAVGLAMVVLVSSLAHVSGGHMNPALLGSTAASFAAKALYGGGPVDLGAAAATVPAVGAAEAFLVEFAATFVFLFVVTALATDPKAEVDRGVDESGEDAGSTWWLRRWAPLLGQGLTMRSSCVLG